MKLFKSYFILFSLLSITVSCEETDNVPCASNYEASTDDSADDSSSTTPINYTTVAPFYPIDFEAGGFGASWTWTVFENDDNPAVEFVENPSKTGINTSDTVAKITVRSDGAAFAGCESKHGEDIGSFSFDATNKTIKIMVYKSVISDVGLKFPAADGASQPEIKVANTLVDQWEELTFDFSGYIGVFPEVIDQIVFFPDFRERTSDEVIYFDYVVFGE